MYQFSAPEDKVKFIFEVYDLDGDGLIQRKELENVMKECIKESNIMFRDHMGMLTSALIEGADTNNTDGITFDAFKNQLEKYEGLLENLSMSIESWLLPSKPKPPITLQEKIKQAIPYQLTMSYMKNNYEFVIFQFCLIAINLALFISRILEYKNKSTFYMLARACDKELKKYSIINHNDTQECSERHKEACTAIDFLFTTKPGGKGLIPGFAYPTGILLVIILAVIFMCSQPFVRRRGNFQAFYWSHTLYVPFWILLILHCKYFWLWFIAPGTIFAIETVMRFLWAMNGKNNTYITSGLLSGEVIALQIQRPLNFLFNPGDYIFVKIPEIAQYEWHPFTISSPPEQEDSISLHIKAVGDWTKQLQKILSDEEKKIKTLELLEKPKTYSSSKPKNAIKRFQATARTVLSTKCDTSVMDKDNTSTKSKATGCGSSPEEEAEEGRMMRLLQIPKDATSNYPVAKPFPVDFIWINKDEESFEWFIQLMSKLEIEQAELRSGMERFLDMHIYLTNACGKNDMQAVSLRLALDLLHEKEKRDLITGLKKRIKTHRPVWEEVFDQIQSQNKGKVTVLTVCELIREGQPMARQVKVE
ncbi:nadph oxidase [Holotrichia oblita]|uniref:Nadph oxidase n=1 Tax=Holotrichia oblita TaxID=644536 RepID=A0ACB9TNK9_HOLOL|nr:nadph oxidase [Holotrichia oblita]